MPGRYLDSFEKLVNMPKSKCEFCGKPASRLCDYEIAMIPAWHSKGNKPELITCDAEICDECATVKSRTFFSGDIYWIDSHDHCPDHADMPSQVPRDFCKPEDIPLIRRRIRKGSRRLNPFGVIKADEQGVMFDD